MREVSSYQEPWGSPRASLLPGDLGRLRELLKAGRDQTKETLERDGAQSVALLVSRYAGRHHRFLMDTGCSVPGVWTGTL